MTQRHTIVQFCTDIYHLDTAIDLPNGRICSIKSSNISLGQFHFFSPVDGYTLRPMGIFSQNHWQINISRVYIGEYKSCNWGSFPIRMS